MPCLQKLTGPSQVRSVLCTHPLEADADSIFAQTPVRRCDHLCGGSSERGQAHCRPFGSRRLRFRQTAISVDMASFIPSPTSQRILICSVRIPGKGSPSFSAARRITVADALTRRGSTAEHPRPTVACLLPSHRNPTHTHNALHPPNCQARSSRQSSIDCMTTPGAGTEMKTMGRSCTDAS